MIITIRQLNGCLSAMQAGHARAFNQTLVKNFIADMIKTKLYEIELPNDDIFAYYVTEMAKLHSNFVKAHGEFRREPKWNK